MKRREDNITFEEFRNRCEDKNTIINRGQLHAGTSKFITINGRQVKQTTATPVPSANSLFVQDLNQPSGLNWKPVFDVLLDAKGGWINVTDSQRGAKNLTVGATHEVITETDKLFPHSYLGYITLHPSNSQICCYTLWNKFYKQEEALNYEVGEIIQDTNQSFVVEAITYRIKYSSENGFEITPSGDSRLYFKYRRIL